MITLEHTDPREKLSTTLNKDVLKTHQHPPVTVSKNLNMLFNGHETAVLIKEMPDAASLLGWETSFFKVSYCQRM